MARVCGAVIRLALRSSNRPKVVLSRADAPARQSAECASKVCLERQVLVRSAVEADHHGPALHLGKREAHHHAAAPMAHLERENITATMVTWCPTICCS